MREYHDLGQFWVPSGQILISDPGYPPGTGHTSLVKKCKIGKWHAAFVEMLPYVNPGMLVIRHESLPDWGVFDKITTTDADVFFKAPWERTGSLVGVDSAQCGFFDADHYQDDFGLSYAALAPDFASKPWNKGLPLFRLTCRDKTMQAPYAGVLPFGAVSGSGYGDGCYPAYQHISHGQKEVDALALVFASIES